MVETVINVSEVAGLELPDSAFLELVEHARAQGKRLRYKPAKPDFPYVFSSHHNQTVKLDRRAHLVSLIQAQPREPIDYSNVVEILPAE